MKYNYIASDNSAGDAETLGVADQDIYVYKIFFGAATGGKVTHLYNKTVAGGHASGMGSVSTNSLAWSFTQPTFAAGLEQVNVVDFGDSPLQLNGGACHTDDDKVTIIWEPVDEAK